MRYSLTCVQKGVRVAANHDVDSLNVGRNVLVYLESCMSKCDYDVYAVFFQSSNFRLYSCHFVFEAQFA